MRMPSTLVMLLDRNSSDLQRASDMRWYDEGLSFMSTLGQCAREYAQSFQSLIKRVGMITTSMGMSRDM